MMKSFEERKTEIRRRSQARIARRRRICRLTGAAVCLLCVAGVAVFRPQPENMNMSADSAAYGYAGGIADEICEPAGHENIPEEENVPESYHFDITSKEAEKVSLAVTKIDTETDTLTMALTNYTDQQLTYSDHIDIQYETQDGWVSCAEREQSWEWALYILEPDNTVTETYWVGGFDLSQPGAYRLIKYCNLYVEEDSTPYRVVAEFTVEEAP